jgi:integrase
VTDKSQESTSNAQQLAALLDATGVDAATLATALETIAAAKQAVPKAAPAAAVSAGKVYLNKEFIYDDENAFIYQRNDTKSKYYYIRIWDAKSKQPYIKSLGTSDYVKALGAARIIYQDIKGKIVKGERVRNITNKQLVDIYLDGEQQKISVVPKAGITKGRFRVKQCYLRLWLEYIDYLGLTDVPIDKIDTYKTTRFGYWLQQKPKDFRDDGTQRDASNINNNISEVLKCYRDVAIRQKYITRDELPDIEKLTIPPDASHKRDILETEQYERLMLHICRTFGAYKKVEDAAKRKKCTVAEIYKRQLFYYFMMFLYETGMRPKELLGLRVNEVTLNKSPSSLEKGLYGAEAIDLVILNVRANNSKTGIPRKIPALLKRLYKEVVKLQNDLGCNIQPNDYLFMNVNSEQRLPYTREALSKRLRTALVDSGLQSELDAENKTITLYSARHAFITWAMRYRQLDLPLLSKIAGTSVQMIMKVYGHIDVEAEAARIVHNSRFGKMRRMDKELELYNQKDIKIPKINGSGRSVLRQHLQRKGLQKNKE